MERPTTKCSVVQLDRPRPPLDKPRSSVSRDRHPHTATPSFTSYPCKPTFRPRRKRSTDRPSVLGFSQHEATENKSCFRQWTGSTLPIKTRYLRRKNKTVSPSDENQQSISPTPPQDRCAAGCLSLPLPRSPSRPSLSKPPPPRPLSPPSTPSTRQPLRSLEGRPRERPNPSLTTSDSSILGLNQVPSLFSSGNVHPFPPGLFNQAPLSSPFVVDPSDDLLDDTTLYWGTDYSLIPSPRTPEMSERRDCNNGSTPFPMTIPFPSPFAEGFDDDSDSSDEMPSSIGSKSPVKIFREDMAIRKAKHRQPKSNNNPTSSSKPTSPVYSPSRSPTAVISSFQPHSLVDPLHPFPAYRLSHPAPDRASPWPEAPSSHYTAAYTHAPSPIATPAPPLSIPRRTLQQPHRLTASDCDMYVAFPQTSHYEVWDMDDDAEISCPVLLCIVDKGRYTGTGTLLAEPDVTLIELSCDDVPVPNTMIRYDRADEYSVIYNDVKTGTNRDQYAARHGGRNQNGQKAHPSVPGPRFIGGGGLRTDIGVRHLLPEQQHEIEVDGRWTRMYARPQPKRNPIPQSRPNPNANTHPSTSNALSSISNGRPNYPPPHHTITPFPLSPPPRTHHDSPPYDLSTSQHYNPAPSRAEFSLTNRPPSLILTHALASGQLTPTHFADTGPARGFYLKLWIPIPLRLFQKRETRLFHIHARVWLNGDEEREGHVNVTERLVEGVKVEGGFPILPGGGVGLGGDGGPAHGCGRRASYGRGHGAGGGTASTSWSQSPVENDQEPTSMPMPLTASGEMSVSHLRSWKCLSSW